jgi:SAM-dependent methyltransferase
MTYDSSFFDYVDETALRSADVVVPLVLEALASRSVLDVGCGTGAWLSVYRRCGVADVAGVDGDYVSRDRLMVPASAFHAVDLSGRFDLNRGFDLVQSLDVAEHIPPASSDVFVENLTKHGRVVLFSAAVPGQGGQNHVNEQPLEAWRARFAARGFAAYDFIRAKLCAEPRVAPWYAYNSILYVHEDRAASLSEAVRATRIPETTAIANVASRLFRLRTMLIRPLPVPIVSRLESLSRRLRVWPAWKR